MIISTSFVVKKMRTVQEQVKEPTIIVMIIMLMRIKVSQSGWRHFLHLTLSWITILRIVGHHRIIYSSIKITPLINTAFLGTHFQEELFLVEFGWGTTISCLIIKINGSVSLKQIAISITQPIIQSLSTPIIQIHTATPVTILTQVVTPTTPLTILTQVVTPTQTTLKVRNLKLVTLIINPPLFACFSL